MTIIKLEFCTVSINPTLREVSGQKYLLLFFVIPVFFLRKNRLSLIQFDFEQIYLKWLMKMSYRLEKKVVLTLRLVKTILQNPYIF